jgi:hypothetical protein
MTSVDFCLAWNWEYDSDFVLLLERECRTAGISFLPVHTHNLAEVQQSLEEGLLTFRAFLDRASDTDPKFLPLVQWAINHAVCRINDPKTTRWTLDKASLHLALINVGLYSPYTIVLPSFEEKPVLDVLDLTPVGPCFVIKPAHGGGGQGVVTEASNVEEVIKARQEFPSDRYLLQYHVRPISLDHVPAYFRILFCTGSTHPCWWNTKTHEYRPVALEEAAKHHLESLSPITESIARLTGLDLFSTEIALTTDHHFIVVDYANDPVDLRLQSTCRDGVPDSIVNDIAHNLVRTVASRLGHSPGDHS